ncbi:hypothetical protein ZWY2020_029755 [Hordeum vulgare]|nr:hypothetical protein ZWY2020_029755 [Hordeum vulgare]
MPPPPLARQSSRRWAPYSKNWLAQARRRRLRLRGYRVDDIDNNGTNLPDDVLSAVFSRLSDTADVVRCANTCRHWGRVVAKEATILSRALPPLPRLALGFFHTERPSPQRALATARPRRGRASSHSPPAPGSSASAAPCPARSQRLSRALAMDSGPLARLPVLEPEVKRPGPKIKGDKLRKFGQGLVLRGVAYWPLMSTVLAVRLDTPEPAEVPMPAGDLSDHPQNFRLLGATPDGRLTFIRAE